MRTPLWETSAGALAAFLNSTKQAYMADLYTITLSGGSVLRYTGADAAVTIAGTTWAIGPVITRGDTSVSVGVTVDSLKLTINADSAGAIAVAGMPLIAFIARGGLDGARIALDRAFSSGPGAAWVGTLGLFAGRVADVAPSRYGSDVTVSSDSELLNVMLPRNVYKPGCSKTLFDGACGLSKASYASAATATSATDAPRSTFSTALAQATDYFSLGWALCLTGANAGTGRIIKRFAADAITTIQPWPAAVAIGDTFTVYPGCDKTQATCNSKFGNLVRFRGFPYVPAPETVT